MAIEISDLFNNQKPTQMDERLRQKRIKKLFFMKSGKDFHVLIFKIFYVPDYKNLRV